MNPPRKLLSSGLTALAAAFLVVVPAWATTTNYSIGLNFGADEYPDSAGTMTSAGSLLATDVAGVPGVEQANWNNLSTLNGSVSSLTADNKGVKTTTSASVIWDSANTWSTTARGSENNGFPTNSANYKLMIGYLDTGSPTTTTINISGLPTGLTSTGYDVYVYALGGAANRGGGYRILSGDGVTVLKDYKYGEDSVNPSTFIEDPGTDADRSVPGDYLVFRGLSAQNIVVEATTDFGFGFSATPRAPVNAVQLVANTSPLTVLNQPANRRVLAGTTNVTLNVTASGGALTYQWYKNSTAISDATSEQYALPTITAADNGATFYAVVKNQTSTLQSSNAVITVGKLVTAPGLVKEELWYGVALADVESGFQNTITPDILRALPNFESPVDQADTYSQRLSALFVPPVTGDYVFFLTADDNADLFISTDDKPAGKYQIAAETSWSNSRDWVVDAGGGSVTQKRSDKWVLDTNAPPATPPYASGIHLTAGKSYYIEADHNEGTGGDNCAVTYKLVSEPDPLVGSGSRLVGAVLGPYAQTMDGGTITIPTQPQAVTATQSKTATLTVVAKSGYVGDTTGVGPAIGYQWQSAPAGSATFTAIAGATSASYTTPILALADSGTQFRVAMLAGDASKTSDVAALTVIPDKVPPLPVEVTSVSASQKVVILTFDGLMDKVSAETGANYVFTPGNISGASASLDASGTIVTITAASPLTAGTNVLAIAGVKDLAGNAVAAGTTITFSFKLVTYEENITFDGPIGYYRFEETTGQTTKNYGSVGAAADGLYMTGNGPDDSAPTNVAVDSGPRPSSFLGFDPNNRAVIMDGLNTMLWIDTQKQFLNNLKAFSLEYWVKPSNRLSDPGSFGTRIGLVGQNDAVEYGFIDNNTIQIWSSGGGSLDTDYNFPDNEWHHIATIADGRNIKNYFDGVLVGTGGSTTSNYGSSIYNVHIGGGGVYDATGNFFSGQFDEVAIFDKAIPAARIAEHFKAGKEGGVITTSGAVTPIPSASITLTVTQSANTLTISWEGSGTLQSATALTGETTTWTDVGTANPASVTIGTGNSFYRVKK